jgi:predicted DNA-binding protein (UPF0251 family)
MNAHDIAPPPLQLPPPELSLHRDHCLALLHRYFMMSVEVGRLPALLGREVFGTRARSYRVTTFEDVVIFVHDVERCLMRLAKFDQDLITRIVFQEYTQEEAAALMGCTRQTVIARFPDALDSMTEIFISVGLLRPRVRKYRKRAAGRGPGASIDIAGCAALEAPLSLPNLVSNSRIGLTARFNQKLVKPPLEAIFAVSA